ncbi:MAG TPA: chloride channel protein [Lichenihabitans sp.]|nr:chloride channel protein [Lichenihabitans sp.]
MQQLDPRETVKVPATLAAPGAGPFWLAVVLTGFTAGGATVLLTLLLKTVQAIAWPAPPDATLLDAAATASAWHHVAVLVMAGLITGVGQITLVRLSSGNSIDITAAIWFAAGRLPALRTLASAVLSIVIVGMGAALGREGAPKQAGAVFANLFASVGRLTDEQRRLLVACGAGAGMAAAYGVPLGGALFALEVLRGVLSLRLVLPALLMSLLATGTAWLVLPNAPTYTIPAYDGSASTLLWVLVAGPIIGIVSVGVVRAIAWADRNRPRGWLRLALPVAAFGGLGLVAIPFPQLLGNGKDISQLAFAGEIAAPLVLVLLVLRPLATFACFGSGAPGGLFTPSLALGALLGGALGQAWLLVWPGAPPGLFALLGAGALLAATTQGPISALVLIMELTGRDRSFIAPLLLIVILATVVSRTIERRSIYEARLSDEQVGRRLAARDHRPGDSQA